MEIRRFRCVRCSAEYGEPMGICIAPDCGQFDVVLPVFVRPADSIWKGDIITSAKEVIRMINVQPLRPYLIPAGERYVAGIYGPAGGGKSTMATRIGDATPGPVLYVPLEEGIGETTRSRLRWLEVVREDFLIAVVGDVATLDRIVADRNVGLVIIDSITVSTLKMRDLVAFSRDRDVSIVAAAQANKQGDIAGDNTSRHLADIVIRVEEGAWSVQKNRFGKLNEGLVLG